MDARNWRRRDVLRGVGAAGVGALAGCGGLLERQPTRNPPVVEDRPDAVYVPTHVEGMEMIGMESAGDRQVGLMYSFAHRFWTVTGTVTERAEPRGDVHLMAAVWDAETETVLPISSGVSMAIHKDGEVVADRTPWEMLSQRMGFHYGDNFFLDGDGTYTVTVELPGMSVDRLGALEGRFEERTTAEFEWEYSQSVRDDIEFELLDDQAGERGALDPMDMMMPLSVAPGESDVPGDVVATGESGDADFLVSVQSGEDGDYLAVSPRTPYNGYVVPMMSLSATLSRDGETVFDDSLREAIGPDLGYHYGATLAADQSVEPGDDLEIVVDSPPVFSRHEGYETAFIDMPDLSLTVE